MQTYEILVQNRAVRANSPDMTLVRTSVGIDQVHILFDNAEWLGFPVTITFANGNVAVTQALALTELNSDKWVAEATVPVPHEVIDMVGTIRVTVQGTDSEGRHIITAKGAPLGVEEAGDLVSGEPPSGAPAVDQWHQAYSDAVTAANDARTAVTMLEDRMDAILANAQASLQEAVDSVLKPATRDSLGIVQVGNNLSITDDGVLSAVDQSVGQTIGGLTEVQELLLYNLQLLAYYSFDATFTDQNILEEGATVKPTALPIATNDELGMSRPDGTTISIDKDGVLRVPYVTHEWEGTVLTLKSASGTSSADLVGPQGPQGEVGPQGPRGPSGYVLTDDDMDEISNLILERYGLGDTTRY